jgi:LytS/YehU family sensor histidine kinase
MSWAVDVEPSAFAIPSFALQTLLENAIKHGVEPRARGGAVEVRVRVDDGSLRVTVSDDGEGADPATVVEAEGRGLHLLSRRLEALYGSTASLSWNTARGQGFTATVQIPVVESGPAPELQVIQATATRR